VARHQKLDEPIWVIALDALRSNGKLQLLLLAGLIVTLGAWIFWPRSEPGISLHTLKREAAQRDGQVVRVDGRVGEVFQVGGGYAFNCTRAATPSWSSRAAPRHASAIKCRWSARSRPATWTACRGSRSSNSPARADRGARALRAGSAGRVITAGHPAGNPI